MHYNARKVTGLTWAEICQGKAMQALQLDAGRVLQGMVWT